MSASGTKRSLVGQADRNMQIAGLIPAFAVFGIYRIWLAIIECSPSRFYYINESAQPSHLKKADPTIEEDLHLGGSARSWSNLLFGVVYISRALQFFSVANGKTGRERRRGPAQRPVNELTWSNCASEIGLLGRQ